MQTTGQQGEAEGKERDGLGEKRRVQSRERAGYRRRISKGARLKETRGMVSERSGAFNQGKELRDVSRGRGRERILVDRSE